MSLLVVIGGPTASGKTSLAIEVAQHFGTHVINADSRQFYREMRIGNARPTEEELAAAPHHFVADRSVTTPLTAGTFAEEALPLLSKLFEQHNILVLAGGSGLYINALCTGLNDFPTVSKEAKRHIATLMEEGGLPALQEQLAQLDPIYFSKVDQQNPRRLQRALEVCISAQQPYSSFLGGQQERPFGVAYFTTYKVAMQSVGSRTVDTNRTALYDRINRRVDLMFQEGLEEEARSLYPHRNLPALQTVGYQELWPYFEGAYDLAEAIELIKRNTRRYAKRQITWFGKGDQYVFAPNLRVILNQIKK
ncbi:MAG: tRNA (adenosine(37)-N6)-dimethylallyltransferase MiaA [Bacteroidota bacterium]